MNRKIFLSLILLLALTPIVSAFTIDAPDFNFVATHGGNVRFANSTVTTFYNIYNTLSRFNYVRFNGGANRGTLAFDCQTGVNMTILGINQFTVTYQVDTAIPGAVTTYVYYANNGNRPTGTNTNTINFNAATDITTVTTIGNGVIVTLDYASLSGLGVEGLSYMWSLFPLIALFTALEARKRDIISTNTVVIVLVFAIATFILIAINSIG